MYPVPGGRYSGSAVGTVPTSSHTGKVKRKCNGRHINFSLMIYTFNPNTWKAERQGIIKCEASLGYVGRPYQVCVFTHVCIINECITPPPFGILVGSVSVSKMIWCCLRPPHILLQASRHLTLPSVPTQCLLSGHRCHTGWFQQCNKRRGRLHIHCWSKYCLRTFVLHGWSDLWASSQLWY